MNKTVSINLGGQVFQIDELAYERLWKYLEAIKLRYANTKGGDEIVNDIESRLAEMFYEAMGNLRQVVTMLDVETVISTMGQPEQFEASVDDEEEAFGNTGSTKTATGEKVPRRLFRNPDDKVLGGVASGLSAYFGINDPIWIRVLFLALFFGFGSGFFLYLALWILVPKANTAGEKLQMRGEPINIDNIEKTIREELNDLEDRINNGVGNGDKARGAMTKLVDFVATVLRLFFKVLGKLIGLFLVVVSILFIISLLLGISIPSMFDDGIAFTMLPYLFESTAVSVAAIIGFCLVFLIPCLFMLYAGVAILLNKRLSVKGTGLTAFGLVVVGIILMVYSIATVSSHTDVTRKRTETIMLQAPIDGILRLQLKDDERNEDVFKTLGDWGRVREENDSLFVRKGDEQEQILLNVKRAPGNDFVLVKTISASGQDRDMAHFRTQNVVYNVTQDSASLYFPLFLAYPVADKIRGQEVRLELLVPEGKSVYLSPDIEDLIYDIKNVTDMYDGEMVGHTWKMLPDGLTCMDCGHEGINKTSAPNGLASPSAPVAPTAPSTPSLPSKSIGVPLSPFTAMDINGAVKFYLIPSTESRIVFENEETQDEVEVDVSGRTLTVSNKGGFDIFRDKAVVWIYTPSIEKVIITGASEGQIGGFSVPNLRVELAGASECLLSVGAGKLTLRLSGASEMVAEGVATELDAEVAGASDLDAYKLASNTAKVHASGASSAEVWAQNKLDAESNGASSIDYKGSPVVSSASSGSSSINSKP